MPVVKTIKPSGGDYSSLTNWEAGRQADLTSTDSEFAELYAGTTETALTIVGWTTTATNYIKIYAAASDRHAGVWDDNKAKIVIANNSAINNYEDYVELDGLQVKTSSANANSSHVIQHSGTAAANLLTLSNCIVVGHNSASYTQFALSCSTNSIIKTFNCIMYGINQLSGNRVIGGPVVLTVYNTTCIGGQYGIRNVTGTVVCKNVYCGGSASGDFNGTISQTTCASSDTTAAGTSLDSIAVNTTNFTNVTAGSEDFRIPGTGSALYHAGTDTSGDSAPLNFTTDINGDTYYSTRSIGADEYVAAGGSIIPILMSYRRRRY